MPKADKKAEKKKEEKPIHPKSRKADQLVRAKHREDGKLKRAKILNKKQAALVEKLEWFKERIQTSNKLQYSTLDTCTMIHDFIHRFDADLEQLRAEKSKQTRVDILEELMRREQTLFTSGYPAPDLSIHRNVKRLREWDGEANTACNIAMKEYKDPGPDAIARAKQAAAGMETDEPAAAAAADGAQAAAAFAVETAIAGAVAAHS
eukprot:tig00000605_g2494.t1